MYLLPGGLVAMFIERVHKYHFCTVKSICHWIGQGHSPVLRFTTLFFSILYNYSLFM